MKPQKEEQQPLRQEELPAGAGHLVLLWFGMEATVLPVVLFVLLLDASCEPVVLNGTSGGLLLWPCHQTFSEPFQPEQSFIYWQARKKLDIVLHVYKKGQQEFDHQSQSFRNRTTVFPDQFPSGNLSLLIDPLMLQDDQMFLEVVLKPDMKPTQRLCQAVVYVAAPFQVPRIDIDRAEQTATCSTAGGFPEPVLTWSSVEGGRSLEPRATTTVSVRGNRDTFNVSSRVSITGVTSVTCEVYNPTSNQTLRASEDVSPSNSPAVFQVLLAIIITFIVLCLPLGLLICKCRK